MHHENGGEDVWLVQRTWFSSQNNFFVPWYIYLIVWTSKIINLACQEDVCVSAEQGQGVLSFFAFTYVSANMMLLLSACRNDKTNQWIICMNFKYVHLYIFYALLNFVFMISFCSVREICWFFHLFPVLFPVHVIRNRTGICSV